MARSFPVRRLRAVNPPPGMKMLFQGKADYLREVADRLRQSGIKVASGPLPGSGWEQRAWLAVASDESERAIALHQRHLDLMVRREGLPLVDAGVDFDAEDSACPACGTAFKTAGTTRCPDCGLNFGS